MDDDAKVEKDMKVELQRLRRSLKEDSRKKDGQKSSVAQVALNVLKFNS